MRSYHLAQDTEFTLDKYLNHIGLSGFKPSVTLQALQTIIEHHLMTFRYQNTALFNASKKSPHEREVPSLQVNILYELMVKHNGGYCMQHLELICNMLAAIGFSADRHLAKIIFQPYSKMEDSARPKTHELIITHLNNKRYIVDVGMGDMCLRKPLELTDGEHKIYDEEYRLTKTGGTWALDIKTTKDNEWLCIYRFFDAPVSKEKLDKAHANLYFSPDHIRIRDDIFFVAETTLEKRKSLSWYRETGTGIFKSTKRNTDKQKSKEISSFDEACSFAEKKFSIKLNNK